MEFVFHCVLLIFSVNTHGYSFERQKGYCNYQYFSKNYRWSNPKPGKIWVHKGSEFYNKSVKLRLGKNAIEMYQTHNEGKSLVAEKFIRTLKTKFISIWLQY